MSEIALVPGAQDAVLGIRCLVAVVEPETGRQIVGMSAVLLSGPLVELRCAGEGFGWHDKKGREWRQADGRWRAL